MSDIWDYSYNQWGADQADVYVLAIHAACERLAASLASGRLGGQSAEHIRTGYRKEIVGSHLEFFFRCQLMGMVNVVRVLNQRMDVSAHL